VKPLKLLGTLVLVFITLFSTYGMMASMEPAHGRSFNAPWLALYAVVWLGSVAGIVFIWTRQKRE